MSKTHTETDDEASSDTPLHELLEDQSADLRQLAKRARALQASPGKAFDGTTPFEVESVAHRLWDVDNSIAFFGLLLDALSFRAGLAAPATDESPAEDSTDEDDDEEDDDDGPETVELYCKRCVGSIVVPGADKNDPAVAAEAMSKGWTQTVGVWRCKACIEQLASRT